MCELFLVFWEYVLTLFLEMFPVVGSTNDRKYEFMETKKS